MTIDTHTHFGDPSQPNELLHRTAMPNVYRELAAPLGVTGTVVVEARRGPDEILRLSALAERDPFILGIVGDIDLGSEDFGGTFMRLAANPFLRGVRFHDRCCYGRNGLPNPGADQGLRRLIGNGKILAARDLALDVHMNHKRIEALMRLSDRLPELRIVINHIAESRPLIREAANPRWADAMRKAAGSSQVYCKVSGLVQQTEVVPAPSEVDHYRATLDVLWDAFGEDRLIYGSNWPQIEAVSDLATAHEIVARYFSEKGKRASEKFFTKNAQAAYRLADRG